MRRAPFVFLAALLGLAAPAAAQDERPKLAATLAACETGTSASERFAVFTGSMPARPGTHRMAMRFDVQWRGSSDASASLRRVRAPKLGRWHRSRRGVAGFVYTKRVTRLRAGRWYRAVVRFRWHDARGRVRKRARRVTPFCHQPDQRPNLQVESLTRPRRSTYRVTVVNTGMTAAPESVLSLEPRPESRTVRGVPPLAPGERASVVVEAEPCEPNAVVVVEVDRFRGVDESREDDNRVELACPAADRLG